MAQINEIESKCDQKINEAHELLRQLELAAREASNTDNTEVFGKLPEQLVRLATKVVNKLERASMSANYVEGTRYLSLLQLKRDIRDSNVFHMYDNIVASLMAYYHHSLLPTTQRSVYLRVLRVSLILARLVTVLTKKSVEMPDETGYQWLGLLFDDARGDNTFDYRLFAADTFCKWLPDFTQVFVRWAVENQGWSHLSVHLRLHLPFARRPSHVVRMLIMLWAIESNLFLVCDAVWKMPQFDEPETGGQNFPGVMN